MSKIFHKIFPIFDYIYILQLMEYEPFRFLRWIIANSFKRNLQRKNQLTVTPKALSLIFISLSGIIATSILLDFFIIKTFSLLFFTVFFLFFMLLSPLFIVMSLFIILPAQRYFEYKLVNKAKRILSEAPNLKIIAISGSYGKTSTKNILYTILWKKFRVVKTPKSFNTLVSIARTIISDIKTNTEVFIVEMDTYKRGDLKRIINFVKPKIGILTAVGPQHLERFGTMDNLVSAQLELVEEIKKGTIVLNPSELISRGLGKKSFDSKVIFFGENPKFSYFVSSIKQNENGLEFRLNNNNKCVLVRIPLFGKHHVGNFLAAATVANILGLSLEEIARRGIWILPTEHRLEIKQLNGITFIDNTYNTNPSVSKYALDILRGYKGNKKIFITPGYIELGKEAKRENIKLILNSSKIADEIIIVGENSKDVLLRGLKEAKFPKQKIHLVKNTKDALATLFSIGKKFDVALFENDLPDQYF